MNLMVVASVLSDSAMPLLTAATVILLYYYTRETYLLRVESQKQTVSLFTPYLSLRNSEDGLKLINLGKGIGKDVIVDTSLQVEGFAILPIPTIGPGEERFLYYPDKEEKGAWHVRAGYVPDKLSLTYLDTLSHKYEAHFVRNANTYGLFSEVSQSRV